MDSGVRWLAGMMAALATGICVGASMPDAVPQQAAAVFAETTQENMFVLSTPAPPDGFSIEVISTGTQQPRRRVLIYHTHTYEAFEQADERYQETEKWRTADNRHNMVRVGEELASLLRALGLEVVHDATAFEPPDLSGAYVRSLEMLESRKAAGEQYDLYIDLHRDAYAASYKGTNTVNVGGTEVAKLMLLIGKGEGQTGQGFDVKPDWQANLAVAQQVTDALNEQKNGLCRDVCLKSGRFNQHVATGCILVEAGNNKNTLDEVLSAMPYLADAIAQALEK